MKTETKHTPGEWKTERIGRDYRAAEEMGMAFRMIAVVASNPAERDIGLLYYKPDMEMAQANASLIAAAPELLEALQALTDWTYNQSAPLESIREQARAAIAKATT